MDDLIAFLRARLDAKQKAAEEAKEASQSAWWFDMEEGDAETATNWALLGIDSFFARASSLAPTAPLKHIAANDPDTVLADVDAKRQIIDRLHHKAQVGIRNTPEPEHFVSCVCGWEQALQDGFDCDEPYEEHLRVLGVNDLNADALLRLLALPHAGHPDYREEWRP